jgi:hypothetical protein
LTPPASGAESHRCLGMSAVILGSK